MKIPNGEILKCVYCRKEIPKYAITYKAKNLFVLYEIVQGEKLTRIGKGSTPLELERKFELC